MNFSLNVLQRHTAILITSLFPKSKWYKIAFSISSLLAYAGAARKKTYRNTVAISHAFKLNHFLSIMTRQGQAFSIPVRAQGLDLFLKPRPNGLILCSTHIPLTKVALGRLLEHGFEPTVVLAATPGILDSIAIWGRTEKVPAIRTGPFVLQKAKTILQQGGSIVVLVDGQLGGPYSPNIFRLAEKVNADIVFFDAALQKDGLIDVSFRESAWNGHRQANCVQEQLNELHRHTASLLQHYNNAGYFTAPC